MRCLRATAEKTSNGVVGRETTAEMPSGEAGRDSTSASGAKHGGSSACAGATRELEGSATEERVGLGVADALWEVADETRSAFSLTELSKTRDLILLPRKDFLHERLQEAHAR